jgi:hypothetical protein
METKTQEAAKMIDFDKKKWLYAFNAKDNDGNDKTFFILKPTRSMRQLGELEYAKQLAFYVKNGLLPKAAWNTILDNLGGTISEPDAKKYADARREFFDLSIEKGKLEVKSNLTKSEKDKLEELNFKIEDAKSTIQSMELEQIYVFENTAEAKARNHTIQWWLVNMAYKSESESFFPGKTIDEKLDWYDSLDSSNDNKNDEFLISVGQRINYLVTLWFLGRVSTPEEFFAADSESTKNSNDGEIDDIVVEAVKESIESKDEIVDDSKEKVDPEKDKNTE